MTTGIPDAVTADRAGERWPGPDELARELRRLRNEMRARFLASGEVFASVHPAHRRSAQNLLDYLTLRSHDLRPLQDGLARLGVSSLGRAEEHVIRSVEQVVAVLQALGSERSGGRTEAAVGYGEGRRMLEDNARSLLGPGSEGRGTRIMVTMPSQAATEEGLVERLIDAGMDVARINCAHDDLASWTAMATRIRRAASLAERGCEVLVDLPGPKLRTGPIAPGPAVARLRPRRDERGVATAPARATLVAAGSGHAGAGPGPGIVVPAGWLAHLAPGDEVALRDTRGSRRTLVVTATERDLAVVEVWDTTYLEPGTVLRGPAGEAAVRHLPPVEQSLRLRAGDLLTLTADLTPARPLLGGPGPRRLRIGCTLPEALANLTTGQPVFLDDGKIGGVVRATRPGEVEVAITLTGPAGARLRAGRGINLPESHLDLPALSPADDEAVGFAATQADLVGLSFAQRPADVAALKERLSGAGPSAPGIILKIETAEGFHRLPELLLAGMAWRRVGVMVARGDLAVECGFERLAEVQDEILWLCDAAHVPVVWATQVLDQMARTGQPSRAEVSDAVLASRAECVMLNKGPHIVEAVATLDDILRRMAAHQRKKVPLLRRLRSWTPG